VSFDSDFECILRSLRAGTSSSEVEKWSAVTARTFQCGRDNGFTVDGTNGVETEAVKQQKDGHPASSNVALALTREGDQRHYQRYWTKRARFNLGPT